MMQLPPADDSEPVWPDEEIAALDALGYVELSFRCNLRDTVRFVKDTNGKKWYVKMLANDSQELAIWKKLLAHPSTKDYIIPTEFHECEKNTLAITPHLITTYGPNRFTNFDSILTAARKVLDGYTRMHDLGIAHFDIHLENILFSEPEYTPLTPGQKEEIFFLMDFGSSRLASFPPGHQPPALTDFRERDGGHWPPPEGMGMVDPYAYDVYSVGKTLTTPPWYMEARIEGAKAVPFSYWVFAHMVCRKKPEDRMTMRRAAQLFSLLESWLKMTQWMYWFLPKAQAKFYDAIGWLALTRIVYLSAPKLAKA